jgi:hypothetical protein
MTDIEIPYEKDRHGHYRFFEILPGSLSWSIVALPIVLSFINATLAVFFILAYLLIFFVRSVAYSVRAIEGYREMKHQKSLDWNSLCAEIEAEKTLPGSYKRPKWHLKNLQRLSVPQRPYCSK